MWIDKTMAHILVAISDIRSLNGANCGVLGKEIYYLNSFWFEYWSWYLQLKSCEEGMFSFPHFLCKMNTVTNDSVRVKYAPLDPLTVTFSSRFILCPLNHTAHSFTACDIRSACWADNVVQFGVGGDSWEIPSVSSCPISVMTSLPPSYACVIGSDRVPYTFVCDHRGDCSDNSDEEFCVFLSCREQRAHQCGRVRQCYLGAQSCDGQMDCVNEEDEGYCNLLRERRTEQNHPPPPPAVIDFLKNGTTIITPPPIGYNTQSPLPVVCPQTHYQCAHNGYCLPTFTRCNAVYDCPDHEDEADCDSYTCPGHYRCFHSQVCVHPSHVCDGVYHCPRSDDELLCDLHCPQHCTCHGLAFTCLQSFPVSGHPDLRYLNVKGSGMTLLELPENAMLVYLNLAYCNLREVSNIILPNLITLDLRGNGLVTIPLNIASDTPNLKTLFLSNNPIAGSLPADVNTSRTFQQVSKLDLSMTSLITLDEQFLSLFPEVTFLNLSYSGTQRVVGKGFHPMRRPQILDLRGCPMTELQKELMQGLGQLHTIHTHNYKLCCVANLLPDFLSHNCHAPQDEVSSCQDLLRSHAYRVCLAIFTCLALVGNGVSFVFRLSSLQGSGSPGFSVFVLHLCVSDFLMGVYLMLVGVADILYQGNYVWKDTRWRHSVSCKLAGFLSLMSCEVSALIICLITLDRFLVVRFPLSFWRFKGWNAQLTCCLSWGIGFVVAVIPLMPLFAHWDFYSQTGICIPLPITRKLFAGRHYSFGIMIVLNFILFLVIAVGQAAIYWSVQSNTLQGGPTNQHSQDNLARRLFTVAISDFLCWFPIGALGLVASRGLPVSGEVSMAIAILVMPLNSALNPFLYTLNIFLEKRRQRKEQQLLKWVESHM